jgi:dolichol-phosphate mannosyltransferase
MNTFKISKKNTQSFISETHELIAFSLIVPTYNERENIIAVIQILSELLDEIFPDNYELIIVDDDSPDRTWEIAQSCMSEYPHLRVIHRHDGRGLSSAVICGWQEAKGKYLGVIDGDLQHPPEVLAQLIEALKDGSDLVVASRHIEGGGVSEWSLLRRFLSRGAQMLGLILLPRVIGRLSDPMSGYFMVRRSAIANKILHPLGYKILIEVLARGDIQKITEVPYVFRERNAGNSKVTSKQYWEYLHHLIRLRMTTGRLRWLKQYLHFPVARFLRFGLVGFSGLFVDMGLLYVLFDGLGLGLTRSALIAAEMAIINNFIWNDFWTFRDLARQQNQWRQRIKRLVKFNVICGLGLGLKLILLNVFFNVFGINAYVANFLAIAIVTIWNFWLSFKLGWRVTQQASEQK